MPGGRFVRDDIPSDLLYFNGIDGATGAYGLPPMSGAELLDRMRGLPAPENLVELRHRSATRGLAHYGVKQGIDPKRLDQAGWGVVFAHGADPAVREALAPLLEWRRRQAGERFRLYDGAAALRPGESKSRFLARHGAGPGPADPARVPYYLLLAGDPETIPYRFQSQLDVQYAVGRLHFSRLDDYDRYARSVVAAEKGEARRSRAASFFGVRNPDDPATALAEEQLVRPLAEQLGRRHRDWEIGALLREDAGKAGLGRLLAKGGPRPALLFSASHGLEFPLGDPRQATQQGALLCGDWPGPKEWRGPIPRDFYFAADDLETGHDLFGLIGFFFACYGLGTPRLDDFARQAFRDQRAAIAPRAFLAALPQRMLAHPAGGALAMIGHVERAWGSSFSWQGAGAQTAVFESTIARLLEGYPVGAALEFFNERYAELSTVLADQLEEAEFGNSADPYELANLWTANNDARGYALLGDPAVRLATGEAEAGAVREEPPVALGPRPSAPPTREDDRRSAGEGAEADDVRGIGLGGERSCEPDRGEDYADPPMAPPPCAAPPAMPAMPSMPPPKPVMPAIPPPMPPPSAPAVPRPAPGPQRGAELPGAPGLEAIEEAAAAGDELLFSAYPPRQLREGEGRDLWVAVHLPEALAAVEQEIRRLLGQDADRHQRREAPGRNRILRDTEILLVPAVAGLAFDPPEARLRWSPPAQKTRFTVTAAGARIGHVSSGTVACYVGPLLVAEIQLQILVLAADGPLDAGPPPAPVSAKAYQAIFASYSHQDTALVKAMEKAYQALGMDYLRDVMTLKSGQDWSQTLLDKIDQADIFQLFWSQKAADSLYVEQEWRHALQISPRKGASFIRPIYWENPMPKVPRELSRLHFAPFAADGFLPAVPPAVPPAGPPPAAPPAAAPPPAAQPILVKTYAGGNPDDPSSRRLVASTRILPNGDVETWYADDASAVLIDRHEKSVEAALARRGRGN